MSDAGSSLLRMSFVAFGPVKTGSKSGGKSGGETLRSIWLASGRNGNTAQQQHLRGFGDQQVLMGRGQLTDIGPGDRDSALVRVEFLLPIRFRVPFEGAPRLAVLPDAEAGEAARQIGLEHRTLASDGFSLVLRPPSGSRRCDIRFYWLAVGTPRQLPA